MDPHQLAVRQARAAEIIGASESWMEKARGSGKGPIYVQLSDGAVAYLLSDLEEFLRSRRRRSTSDAPGRAQEAPSRESGMSGSPQHVSRTGRSPLPATPAPPRGRATPGRRRARRRNPDAETDGKTAGD